MPNKILINSDIYMSNTDWFAKGNWSPIPRLLQWLPLDLEEFAIMAALTFFIVTNKQQFIEVSATELSQSARMSLRTVRDRIKRLCDRGYIKNHATKGHKYKLTISSIEIEELNCNNQQIAVITNIAANITQTININIINQNQKKKKPMHGTHHPHAPHALPPCAARTTIEPEIVCESETEEGLKKEEFKNIIIGIGKGIINTNNYSNDNSNNNTKDNSNGNNNANKDSNRITKSNSNDIPNKEENSMNIDLPKKIKKLRDRYGNNLFLLDCFEEAIELNIGRRWPDFIKFQFYTEMKKYPKFDVLWAIEWAMVKGIDFRENPARLLIKAIESKQESEREKHEETEPEQISPGVKNRVNFERSDEKSNKDTDDEDFGIPERIFRLSGKLWRFYKQVAIRYPGQPIEVVLPEHAKSMGYSKTDIDEATEFLIKKYGTIEQALIRTEEVENV